MSEQEQPRSWAGALLRHAQEHAPLTPDDERIPADDLQALLVTLWEWHVEAQKEIMRLQRRVAELEAARMQQGRML